MCVHERLACHQDTGGMLNGRGHIFSILLCRPDDGPIEGLKHVA
jgi:hypothetical protein